MSAVELWSGRQRGRPLDVGLILTPIEDRARGQSPSWAEMVEVARLAEAVGFDSIWISDHLIHRFPGVPDYGIWECWSLVAALAASTRRVRIGTWVLGAGFRNPALLAKMAATVDEISGGRLVLGIGAGWHEPEYRAFGYPFDHRVERFAEAIAIIHGLLRTGHVDFDGRFYQARDCALRPRGPRPDGIPLMIGTIGGTPLARRLHVAGSSPRMLDLVTRYAEIWNCPWINDPAEVPAINAMVDTACRVAGREPASLARTHGLMLDLPGWRDQPGNAVVREGRAAMGAVEGSPDELAELLRRFAAAGIAEVHVHLDPETPAALETFARVLESLDRNRAP
jgi:alkanesulfonate monooxygenase SsuD/methylene tetrahydromethanopterin reductase-like flavin-dependent oxidoreductase (luciferase family)